MQTELERLVERSNRLGADPTVVNWRGGNTSVKGEDRDVDGTPMRVMWVKGSGSDLHTATEAAFCRLRLDPILPLMQREAMTDEEMVAYLLRCMTDPAAPRPSIETLLHAFIEHPHVDHTHPDAILSICNAVNGEALMKEAFGDSAVWIPYIRPGFLLSKQVAEAVNGNPNVRAVFLGKHGLVTWGTTSDESYKNTLDVIGQAADFIASRSRTQVPFGEPVVATPTPEEKGAILDEVLPRLRGAVSKQNRMVLHFDDSDDVMSLVNSPDGKEIALRGSACPDHLVHTKYLPLWIDWNPADGVEALCETALQQIEEYADAYRRYVDENKDESVTPGDPYPRIILIPGLGMVATGKDADVAKNAAGLYHRAIAVMHGASSIDSFQSMTASEAFGVEYWPLELYKLTLAPPERDLSRRVALVTGAASGIGRASALLLAEHGAHVAVTDINAEGAEKVAEAINQKFGNGRAISIALDVTNEEAVAEAFSQVVRTYGGVDVVVSNAGIASASPIEETTLAQWQKLQDVLATGYFLVAREAFRIMKRQGIGGSIVFVTSKNAMVASKGAAAYNAAKAAELHLARSLAEEGGPHGIRVNAVAPDAVLEGSGIWSGKWREERAAAYGIAPEELEAFYRDRTTLKVNVYPEDIAQAILFFATDRASRTTGCTLTVDGGNAAAYMR